MNPGLEGKSVLVTGRGKGIGLACAAASRVADAGERLAGSIVR